MSERKKIVIDLEESEKVKLGERSELNSIDASGVLSVNNVSERSRIWNVKVHLGETRGATDIGDEKLVAGEIDVGGKWEANYGLNVESPILTFKEVFDTCGTIETDEPHWAYVKDKENPVKITLTITNETDGEIDNIILNKTIPPELSNIEIMSVKSGNAEYDEGTKQVVWKDFVVYPHESSSLVLRARGYVDDTEPKGAGDVVITYRGEDQQRSNLNPDLTALTEFLTGIETAETEPNQWQCTLECSNESDLIVRLDKAEVYLTPEDGSEKQKMIEETPGIELEPNQEWTSSFEVESKSTPKCTQDIIYTPAREIKKRVLGTIKKVPQEIPVYSIDYEKTFDPPSVSSFDKTPVEVTIEVTNNGSAKINEITIEDNLPDDVMPPTSEHVTVWIRNEEYTGPFEFVIDPEDQDPEKPHKISFRLEDLRNTVGELEPGESIKINYAIMAWRSRPEKEYPSPVTCTANTEPAGVPAIVGSPEDGHKLGVIYKKRAISTKKAINKGVGAGEYIVVLVVTNSGEVTAENIQVSDWIPSGFDYVSTDPEEDAPEVSAVSDGSKMVWTWTRMNPGDKKKLRVIVQGEGEYERREPEVTSI
ncbi:MAG: hypothetical protein AM325_000825 [Candidatus Thorarchaeota archaeon SMTZ1-45]|nr:MAG: hypothetical protein AM325_02210 [Candidatus Thorarchaeota archaeon SMTZ1-45]